MSGSTVSQIMLLSTHSGRLKRAFVFVLPLNRHGPECQQITFFKSVDGKGSCNSFNKYFARLICIRSLCAAPDTATILTQQLKKYFFDETDPKSVTWDGGRGKRSSMKVIRDGLSSDNPALIGAQIPAAKNAFTRRVLMIDDGY